MDGSWRSSAELQFSLHHHICTVLRGAVGLARQTQSESVGTIQVRSWTDVDGRWLCRDGRSLALRTTRTDGRLELACDYLHVSHLGRAVLEPGRTQLDDEARTCAFRRTSHGRLVFGDRHRQ